jgi:hypothetical protein
MTPIRPIASYSNESINEVCSSTASLSVSSNPIRDYDSPTVVSYSSSQSSTALSDQFDDAPEDNSLPFPPVSQLPAPSMNPLDALAMACAAENAQQEKLKPDHLISTAEWTQTGSFQISQNDVLCGRGGLTNHHPGNVFFRRLVRIKQEAYLKASKREKAGVAKEIVELIRGLSPSGRFLKKDSKNPGVWVEIGDRKAREKTSQALREGAPELREELNSDKNQGEDDLFVDGLHDTCQDAREHQNPTWSTQVIVTPSMMEKPHSVNSNRVRVVSSDSCVGGGRAVPHCKLPNASSQPHIIMDDATAIHIQSSVLSLYPNKKTLPYRHPQPFNDVDDSDSMIRPGSKRKSVDLASSFSSDTSSHSDGAPRGPRLKLLKKRLQSSCKS